MDDISWSLLFLSSRTTGLTGIAGLSLCCTPRPSEAAEAMPSDPNDCDDGGTGECHGLARLLLLCALSWDGR
jgi:hypothetical protein